jgi:hypothetical protein
MVSFFDGHALRSAMQPVWRCLHQQQRALLDKLPGSSRWGSVRVAAVDLGGAKGAKGHLHPRLTVRDRHRALGRPGYRLRAT